MVLEMTVGGRNCLNVIFVRKVISYNSPEISYYRMPFIDNSKLIIKHTSLSVVSIYLITQEFVTMSLANFIIIVR